jgi:digeranylgeranylglycerophospholipid reductase
MPTVTAGQIAGRYDCVIAGAGPAGLNTARRLREIDPAIRILLVEKSVPWGKPKPCAEAVGLRGFHEAAPVQESWIRHRVSKAAFHSPNGSMIAHTDPHGGYIIDRALMQGDLARMVAAGDNLHLVTQAAVTAVSAATGGVRAVSVSGELWVKARIVVDACGTSSPLGKSEKITWKAYDAEPAFFAIADGVEHARDVVHIHVGRDIAPGGYAWMFPGAEGLVNVGIVVGSGSRRVASIRDLLAKFIKTSYPSARVRSYHAGTIANGYQRGPIAVPGLVKVGDAANTTNPMSRAGIVEALKCGILAADCVMAQLGASTERQALKACSDYEKAWYEKLGKRHQKLLQTKGALAQVPDRDYDAAVEALSGIPQSELTMGKIFAVALGRFPRLVWAMRHMV